MNFKKHAIILAVIDSLHRHRSWTGKTHVQKALSLLRDKGTMDVPFDFVLYRHGPYSFDVESELEQMRSYDAIVVDPNAEGYGVVLHRGGMAEFVGQFEELSTDDKNAIDEVCEFVGSRNVGDLERLATASWIHRQECVESSPDVARRLNHLKPHISTDAAERAFNEVADWLDN